MGISIVQSLAGVDLVVLAAAGVDEVEFLAGVLDSLDGVVEEDSLDVESPEPEPESVEEVVEADFEDPGRLSVL
jgi:hypothetical protein